MSQNYNRVKFYSANDFSIPFELEKAEPILSSFSSNSTYDNINAIIELYNIQQLMDTNVVLRKWDEAQCEQYKKTSKLFNGVIGRFFSTINTENFIKIVNDVCGSYIDDFWELIEKYKTYERISVNVFIENLKSSDGLLCVILKHKKIVELFNSSIADFMRIYQYTAEILVSKYLSEEESEYHIPSNLNPLEYEQIFNNYIDSQSVEVNILPLIFNAQNTKECPISDKLRLKAQRRYETILDDMRRKKNIVSGKCKIEVGFTEQDEIVKYENNDLNLSVYYDTKWLENNLDYPTIMNNFIYVFELFDMFFRYTSVSIKSKVGVLEGLFKLNGKKYFNGGLCFEYKDSLSALQVRSYCDFLSKNNIELEDVFKWFFEKYLFEEFNVSGFLFNSSSATVSYLGKNRNIASEQDGVLKQFRMFVEDGEIDRELFEISSKHITMGDIPSMITSKYAYPNSKSIENEIFLLFSDQSPLLYTQKTKSSFNSLYELLMNKKMILSDFVEYQQSYIKWLIERECLIVTDNDIIKLENSKVFILKDIFDYDVLCLYKINKFNSILEKMISDGDLIVESTLFSRPESDYLNYKLNRSEFSNGLDLRNKYIHSTNTTDENQQISDYIEFIKIMVLIIVKINDEFCHIHP